MSYIHDNNAAAYLDQDLRNLKASLKRARHHGLASTDALLEYLATKDIHHHITVDRDDGRRAKELFITYLESIKLALQHHDVLLLDNTYKTNAWELPLLHVVGTLYPTQISGRFSAFRGLSIKKTPEMHRNAPKRPETL